MVKPAVATTVADLSDAIRAASAVNIIGRNSKKSFRLVPEAERAPALQVAVQGIREFSAEDQVVVVGAGTLMPDLLEELKAQRQCLPIPFIQEMFPMASGYPVTVGGAISMNLPHGLEAQCGTWRDWVLGMTVVLADGTIARSGSKAVKSVAGYDAHKLMIGARGTLGVIGEVILRTFPLDALPEPKLELRGNWEGGPVWIQRTLPFEFHEAVDTARGRLLVVDWGSCTFWSEMEPEVTGIQFTDDWFVREGYVCGDMIEPPPDTARLMKRAKEIFDPTSKLNPGEMGIF